MAVAPDVSGLSLGDAYAQIVAAGFGTIEVEAVRQAAATSGWAPPDVAPAIGYCLQVTDPSSPGSSTYSPSALTVGAPDQDPPPGGTGSGALFAYQIPDSRTTAPGDVDGFGTNGDTGEVLRWWWIFSPGSVPASLAADIALYSGPPLAPWSPPAGLPSVPSDGSGVMGPTEPNALDFDLIPPDPGLINPDLALTVALAPVVDAGPDAPIPFGKSWRFDFLAGQFVRDGTAPQATYELDSLIMWIEKTIRTARYAHAIYSDQYGIEEPDAIIGEQIDADQLAAYEDGITEALMVHDRIVSVEEFNFSQDPFDEVLYASFTVTVDVAPPLEAQPLEFSQVPLT